MKILIDERFLNQLEGFKEKTEKNIESGIEKFANELKEEIERRAPVSPIQKPVKIKNSIIAVKSGFNEWTVGVKRDAFWAYFVEFGHAIKREKRGKVLGYVQARPFVRPAFESFKKRIKTFIGE